MKLIKKIKPILVIVTIASFLGLMANPCINASIPKIGKASINDMYSSPAPFLIDDENFASQNDKYDWNKTFGGTKRDSGYSVRQTRDGGYIIVGDTESFRSRGKYWDVWLIKTDSRGEMEWNRTFGGSDMDSGFSVQQTSDGGYIITGETYSYAVDAADVWLIKTDSDGNEEWNKTFGGSLWDEGYSVQQTSDGGYIIAGEIGGYYECGDVWLIKTDSNGNEQWNRTFGGSDRDIGRSVQQNSDGGYVITGSTYSYGAGSCDILLIKTDSNGNQGWVKAFGGVNYDVGRSVQQTTDGGYVITGSFMKRKIEQLGIRDADIWLIKTDSQGGKQWTRTFGSNGYNEGHSVQQTSDGGYVVVGHTLPLRSLGNGRSDPIDIWLIKTDSNGNEQWIKKFGGEGYDYGHSVQQTSDGGFVIVGETGSFGAGYFDVWLIKVSPIYIARPKGGHLYIADKEIMSIPISTIIIGEITVKINSHGSISIFNKVEFYVDDELKYIDTKTPFEWLWDKIIFGKHSLKVVAYDNAGNSAGDKVNVIIFNL